MVFDFLLHCNLSLITLIISVSSHASVVWTVCYRLNIAIAMKTYRGQQREAVIKNIDIENGTLALFLWTNAKIMVPWTFIILMNNWNNSTE